METVGLKELKAHLGDYVARASDGERIVITDHGKEVAELVPLTPARRYARGLVREGKARWGGGKPIGLRGITAKGGPVADTVLEDRG